MFENKKENNDTLSLFVGIILLGVGLFLFSNQVSVGTSWYNWRFLTIGKRNFTNGLISVPLIIGIVMMFYNPKSLVAKIIIALGAIFIIATVIMSINFRFESTTLFNYVLMIGMTSAGAGMILKAVFKKKSS